MKEQVVTCDLCQGEMYDNSRHKSGYSLHIKQNISVKRIWWFLAKPDHVDSDMDICEACYHFIQEMLNSDTKEIRTIYEMYCRMCPADMEVFRKELFEMAKETDRYYQDHPVNQN